jgi:hypothetical protein
LFADPSQQPVVVRPPYDRMADPLFRPVPWRRLADDPPTGADLADYRYLAQWRSQFDYVLLAGPPPAGPLPAGLSLIRAGEAASLYRVRRQPAVVSPVL